MKSNRYSIENRLLPLFVVSCILGSCCGKGEEQSGTGKKKYNDDNENNSNDDGRKVEDEGGKISLLLAAKNNSAQNKTVSPMGIEIINEFFRILFYRRDLIDTIKPFLFELRSDKLHPDLQILQFSKLSKDIPPQFRTPQFLSFLRENGIEITDFILEEKNQNTESEDDPQFEIKEIIKKDDLGSLQQLVRRINDIVNYRIVDSFLKGKAMEFPLLHYCVIHNAMRCFKYLLVNGIGDPSPNLSRPLYPWDCMALSVFFGRTEMMSILEENNYNISANLASWEAAIWAYRNRYLKGFIAKTKEEENPNLQEFLNRALFRVAMAGNFIKAYEILISNGANINAKDDGKTPLHYAIWHKSKGIGKLLISKGADINAKDELGDTPLHYAVRVISLEMVKFLVDHKANVDVKNNDFESASSLAFHLHFSNIEQFEEVVKIGEFFRAYNRRRSE